MEKIQCDFYVDYQIEHGFDEVISTVDYYSWARIYHNRQGLWLIELCEYNTRGGIEHNLFSVSREEVEKYWFERTHKNFWDSLGEHWRGRTAGFYAEQLKLLL